MLFLVSFVWFILFIHRMLHGRRLTTLLLIVVLLNPSRIDSDRSRGTRGKLFQLATKPHAFACKGIEENLSLVLNGCSLIRFFTLGLIHDTVDKYRIQCLRFAVFQQVVLKVVVVGTETNDLRKKITSFNSN